MDDFFHKSFSPKFASARGLKLTVKVEVSPEGALSRQNSTKPNPRSANLGLNEDAHRVT